MLVRKIALALFFCFFAKNGHAQTGTSTSKIETPPQPVNVSVDAKSQSTTDGLYLRTWGANVSGTKHLTGIAHGDWDYRIDTALRVGRTLWDHFESRKIIAGISHQFNDQWRLGIGGGQHTLETLNWFKKDVIYSNALISWSPIKENSLALNYTHDLLYQDWVSPGSVDDGLVADNYSVNISSRPVHKVRFDGRLAQLNLNDGNSQQIQEANFLYGLSADWPWIWAGVGALRYAFKEFREDYWTPHDWLLAGLRFESSVPVYKKLSLIASLQLNYSKEYEQDRKFCRYNELGFNYKVSSLDFTAKYISMGDLPGYSDWRRNDFTFTLASQF